MNFDPENPFSELDKNDPNTIQIYFKVESEHMASSGYSRNQSNVIGRRSASRFLKKHVASEARDPVVPFLAMNYFDNYVSSTDQVPRKLVRSRYMGTVISICCFISAWRMRSPQFSLSDFMIKHKLKLIAEEIADTEALIDECLHTRKCKRPVTALCFLDYLIGTLPELNELEIRYLKSFATHKLYALQYDMRITEFKPSIIAAAALASCLATFFKRKHEDLVFEFLNCEYLGDKNGCFRSLKHAIELVLPDIILCISDDSDDEAPDTDSHTTELPAADRNLRSNSLIAAMCQSDMLPPHEDEPPDSHTSTAKIMMPESDYNAAKIELPSPDNVESNSLMAAMSQSKMLPPPDGNHVLSTDAAQLMLPPPDCRPGSCTDTAKIMLPVPDRSCGSLTDTAKLMRPAPDRSQESSKDIDKPVIVNADQEIIDMDEDD